MISAKTSGRFALAAAATGVLALLGACSKHTPPPAFNAPADVAEINRIEGVMANQVDVDKVIGFYAPDATVLDIYAPGIYKGRDQIRAGFAPLMASLASITGRMNEINIASDGKFACAAMQIHFDAKLKDGKSLSMSVRQLDAFKKIDGEWKIVQQHISLPIDQKTGMALLDGAGPARGPIAWSPNPLPGPASTPDEAKKAIRNWMEVGGASTSLDMMMGYYGPGDDILVYDSYPSNMRGKKEVSDYFRAIMGSFTDPKIEMPEFVVDSDGLFGVQIDTQHLSIKLKDGSRMNLALRQSDCMRKSGDRWYSFLEHLSFAVDPKTGKAISSY